MDEQLVMRSSAAPPTTDLFPWVLLKILLYAFTFRAIQYFLVLVQRRERNNGQSGGDERKNWRIANETTNLVHSIVSGSWALSSLIKQPRMWTDMLEWYDDSTYSLVLMYVGYLMNDTVDLITNERSPRAYELLIHHSTALTAFGCSVYSKRFVALGACALLMEVNGIFLYARSVMNMRVYDRTSIVYRAVICANIITFVIFRVVVTAYMGLWIWSVRKIVETFYVIVGLVGSLILTVMNASLLHRVLKVDYFSLTLHKSVNCAA